MSTQRVAAGTQGPAATPLRQEEWGLYYAWGRLPEDAAVWKQVVDFLFGYRLWLLYIGITNIGLRGDVARWQDHEYGNQRYNAPPKAWARRVVLWEYDRRRFSSEKAAEEAEKRAIQRLHPLENTAHNGGNPQRPTRRRYHRPTWFAVWRAKVGSALLLWALLAYVPFKVVTDSWPAWGPQAWWALGATAALMLGIRLLLARNSKARN